MLVTYVALVDKASANSANYGVCFPDFPGCVFGGNDIDAAIESARDGLIFHIEGLIEEGHSISPPTLLEEIVKHLDYKKAIPVLIRVVMPTGHIKRVNICFDEALLNEIDKVAKDSHRSRSELLAEAAKRLVA